MLMQWTNGFTVIAVITFQGILGEDLEAGQRHKFPYNYLQNYGSSWIAGPDGHYYQFHLSEQSWSIDREYCLTLASDLVIIRSLEQMMWLLAHYPTSYSKRPERTVQIGLVLSDQNRTEKEWRWVDDTKFNADYLEWEVQLVKKDDTKYNQNPLERGHCAVLSIDNLILRPIQCDKSPEFDYTNRFICERSEEQHHEHEKRNNPVWKMIAQLINLSRNDEESKTKLQTFKQRKMEKPIASASGNVEDSLPPINNTETTISDENNEYQILKVQKIAQVDTNHVDLNAEGSGEPDLDEIHAKDNGEVEKKATNGSNQTFETKNFLMKGESSMDMNSQEDGNEKHKGVPIVEATGNFKRTTVTSHKAPDVNFSNQISQTNGFYDENNTMSVDFQSKNEKWSDFFRNFNLFLKQATNSDLRTLLDDNNTNKSLIERLKEAVQTTGITKQRNLNIQKMQRMLQSGNDDREQQQQDQSDDDIQYESAISNVFIHEVENAIDSAAASFEDLKIGQYDKSGPLTSNRLRYTLQPEAVEFRLNKLAKQLATQKKKAGVYEQIKKEIEAKPTEHVEKQPDLESHLKSKLAEISEETEYTHQNKTSAQYYPVHGQPSLRLPLSTASNRLATDAANASHVLLNRVQKTTKKSETKPHNKLQNTFDMTDCKRTLLYQIKTNRNEINIVKGIERAALPAEQLQGNANKEFSHSQ